MESSEVETENSSGKRCSIGDWMFKFRTHDEFVAHLLDVHELPIKEVVLKFGSENGILSVLI